MRDQRSWIERALRHPALTPSREVTLLVSLVELLHDEGDRDGAQAARARLRRVAKAAHGQLQQVAFEHLRRLAADEARRSFERPSRVRLDSGPSSRRSRPDPSQVNPASGAGLGKLLSAALVIVLAGCAALAFLAHEAAPEKSGLDAPTAGGPPPALERRRG